MKLQRCEEANNTLYLGELRRPNRMGGNVLKCLGAELHLDLARNGHPIYWLRAEGQTFTSRMLRTLEEALHETTISA